MSSFFFIGDLKGLRPKIFLGKTFSLATLMGLLTPVHPRSMNGESAGFSGATLRERFGLPLVEHGAEREIGKGAEKGSKGEGRSEFSDGSALRLNGSHSGEGKGWQFVKGLVGEGLYPSRGLVGLLVETVCWELHFSIPPAEMKLQGSIRGRLGDGRGRGMMFTSKRRVLGLQRQGSGYRANGTGDFSSASIVSWHNGRSNTEKKKNEKRNKILDKVNQSLYFINRILPSWEESPWLDLLLLSPVWFLLSLSVSPLAIHSAQLCWTGFRLDLSLSLGFGGGGVSGNGLFSGGFSELSRSSWGKESILNVIRSPTKTGSVGKSTTASGGCSRPKSRAGTFVLWAVLGGGIGGCWGSRWRPRATEARRAAPLSKARWVLLVWGGTLERQSKFGELRGDKYPSSLPESSSGRAVQDGSLTELGPRTKQRKSEQENQVSYYSKWPSFYSFFIAYHFELVQVWWVCTPQSHLWSFRSHCCPTPKAGLS